MRLLSCRVLALAIWIGLFGAAPPGESRQEAAGGRVEPEVHGELHASADGRAYVLITLRDAPPGEIEAVQEAVLASLETDAFEPVYRYRTFPALTGRVTAGGLAALALHPEVRRVGVDRRVQAGSAGPAALSSSVAFIGADQLHAVGIRGEGVTVAVLDTGADSDHPDLQDDLVPGAWHFLDQGATTGPGAEDGNGHGTHVAGIVTAGGAVGRPGVAPDAGVLAVQVLGASGGGWTSDVAAGIDYVTGLASQNGELRVINMSIGSNLTYADCPCDAANVDTALLGAALDAAAQVGLLSFAASLNHGEYSRMSSPACLSSVTAVAAVYEENVGHGWCGEPTGPDVIVCFTNRSPCNALAAPGFEVVAHGLVALMAFGAVWKSNFGRPTPSTRRCRRDRIGSMAL